MMDTSRLDAIHILAAPPPPGTPVALTDLWLPIGPSTVLGGQPAEGPNVTGRVRQVKVSPDGTRVYAAAAGGGVWYSRDEGASWMPLGGWLMTADQPQYDFYGNSLVSGCLAVDWDTTAGGENDTVYVGTGEITPDRALGVPGGDLAGVGVLRAEKPAPTSRANPFDPVWNREGEAMAGSGIYRVAINPAHHDQVAAATSDGLYVRTGAATWTKVTAKPFNESRVVTDAWWAPAPGGPAGTTRLWVAVEDAGLWFTDQATASFNEVGLPGRDDGRLGLAFTADGTVGYVLGAGPCLWRVAGGTAKTVANVPASLFGSPDDKKDDQAFYDLALAVDPTNPDVVVFGGADVDADHAALFKCTVQDPGGAPHLDYNPAHDRAPASPADDPTFIGAGVHADVHCAEFAARAGSLDLWVTCDGGIYRSARAGRSYTWQPRNNGLAVTEPGYLACHPVSEAVVVVGTQDNGILERTGDTAWTWTLAGDGGGVAFDPAEPSQYVAQAMEAFWRSKPVRVGSPVWRGRDPNEKDENGEANFYSSPGVVAATNAYGARLAVGTNRVWVSENFGINWYTVKTGSDPRGGTRHDPKQDVRYDDRRDTVLVCRWKDENELYVLCDTSVQRFTLAPGTGAWDRTAVTDHKNKSTRYDESDIEDSGRMKHLPPLGQWSDLALHLPGPNGTTTLYVAGTGLHATPRMDTLWWYDGQGTWHATGLRAAVKAPALTVAVHPTDPDTVFVGTTLGVWKGTLTHPAAGPHWDWTPFNKGLPEAAVHDFALYRDPPNGAPTMLLLRAALAARGAWEVDLLAPCDEKTYLRVHRLDSRRRPTTPLANPMALAGQFALFASPDVAVRPAPPPNAAAVPLPADAFFPIRASRNNPSFELWTFQTAFRTVDPLCRPTGRWSTAFQEALVDHKRRLGLGLAPQIDKQIWQNVVDQARVYQPPWDGPGPTEADLLQLVQEPMDRLVAKFSTRRFKIDVLVHQRGLRPVPPADVSVLLLLRKLTEREQDWPALPVAAAWKAATVTALTTGNPPGGGWPDHWVVADNPAVRHPAGALDAARPQAATFDLTFPAAAHGHYLLLAVCSSATATVSAARLSGATLRDLLLNSSHVAARAFELK